MADIGKDADVKTLLAKTCLTCGRLKPATDFYWHTHRNGRKWRGSHCRPCSNAKVLAYRQTPQGAAKMQVYNQRAKARSKGMDPEAYVRGLARNRSGGICDLCGRSFPRLEVDHDHETGVIRGHLCRSCNVGLGLFGDDPERLQAAAAYLHTREEVTGCSPPMEAGSSSPSSSSSS